MNVPIEGVRTVKFEGGTFVGDGGGDVKWGKVRIIDDLYSMLTLKVIDEDLKVKLKGLTPEDKGIAIVDFYDTKIEKRNAIAGTLLEFRVS